VTLASAQTILDAALAREAKHGIRLIGVDGKGGSGKSTLARRLAELSGAPVIEVDDFVSWNNLSSWWPRFVAQVIEPLLAGREAHFQARDWHNDWFGDSLGGWKTVPWHHLVIVEGVTCTRRAAAPWLCYAVWVDAPAEVRLARGLARDHAHRDSVLQLWQAFMAEEDRFFTEDDTAARADLVLSTAEKG